MRRKSTALPKERRDYGAGIVQRESKARPARTVGAVGAGTMGSGIAQRFGKVAVVSGFAGAR